MSTRPAGAIGWAAVVATAWIAALAPAAAAQTVAHQVDAAHTGATPSAVAPPLAERWRRTLDPSIPIDHTVRHPLVADGMVFVSVQTGSDAPAIHALDASTGATRWTRTLSGWLRGAGYGDGKVIVSTDSAQYALDAATGSPAWTSATGSGSGRGAVVAGGVVYVSYHGAVTALRLSGGGQVWTRTGLHFADGVAVAGERVYVNDLSAAVALRRSDGQVLWRYEPPTYTSFSYGEPAVRDGRVYLPGVPQGAVLDAATGELLRRPWIHASVALDGERAYILDSDPGEWAGEVLHVRDADDGATRWEFGAEEGITTSPLVSGETVYAMGVRGALYGLDRGTGRLTWCGRTGTVNYSGSQVSLAAGEGLLVLAIGGEVVALGHGGGAGCDYYGVSIPGYHGTGSDAETEAAGARASAASTARAAAAAPAGFEPNRGQFPASVRYAARGPGHTLLVGRDGATLALPAHDGLPGGGLRVDLRLRGARAARAVRGEGRLGAVVNDYRGADPARWRTGVALQRRVRLERVRPGVDMVLRRGGAESFEYDLVVAPGADARGLALEFRGGTRPRLDGEGGLVIRTPAGFLRQPPPVAYQRRAGRRERVPARFRLLSGGAVGFTLGAFDRRHELVIDPVLEWGSFLGGGVDDASTDVATDAAGFVYVAGRTGSRDLVAGTALDGWDERNAICEERPCGDAFVAKYRPGGAGLVHVTYLSGRREDRAEAVAADDEGNAYVSGYTMSPNFPVANALQPELRCGVKYGDAFVVKLAPDGTRLEYATYLGGCDSFLGEAGRGIAVDAQGRAVVAGHTDSFGFPTTEGASDRTCAPAEGFCDDAFVAKLSQEGARLEWSTLFGGDGSQEYAFDVALDAQGRPVIAGTAYGFSTTDFPATPGAYDEEISPWFGEVFAARLSADGSDVEWATAFGGRDWDEGRRMALDAQGDVHIAGRTESSDFPTTAGAHDRVCNAFYEEYSCTNHADGFALELSADGARLLASTYVGGAGSDSAGAIALDGDGRAYLTGAAASGASTFPLVDAFQAQQAGQNGYCASRSDCGDAYVMRLSADKSRVEYASFLGGRSYDLGSGIALDGEDAWVTGFTHSTDLATTSDGTQPVAPGGDCGFMRDELEFHPCTDAFLSRIGPQPPAPAPAPAPGADGSASAPLPVAPAAPGDAPAGGTDPSSAGAGVTLEALVQTRRIRARRTPSGVRGRALSADGACRRRVPVVLQRRARGRWSGVARVRTGAAGRFEVVARMGRRAFRVRLPELTRALPDGRAVRCAVAVRALPPGG